MLLRYDGASKLGKILRRPFTKTMSSFNGTATFAADAMRSTITRLRGGRALSAATRSGSTPQQMTWHPTHGIVFNSNPSSPAPRLFGSSARTEVDLVSHSNVEDNYVMASVAVGSMRQEITEQSSVSETKPASVLVEPPEEAQHQDPAHDHIPETTLSYKMTEDLFRAAKKAEPLSPESYWLHTLYRGPSDKHEGPKVKVHYCQSRHTTERVLQEYFMDQKVIGFDIEWKADSTRYSGVKKNVSLIQIACEERIALFHVALYAKDDVDNLVAPSLKKIMEDPNVTKVGVAIKADCTRLRKFLNIHSRGLFELSHLHRLVKYSKSGNFKQINKMLVSLATQVQEHLHLPMFKGGDVRSSDWSKKLDIGQITYAAADTYAGIQIYNILELKRKALDPTPPRPYHADLNKPIRLAEGVELLVEEPSEELEPEEPELTKAAASASMKNLPASDVESDPDADFEPSQEISTPSSSTTTRSKSRTTTTNTASASKHPLLVEAETRLASYRDATSSSTLTHRATPANLRAYFVWSQNPSLSIGEIAAVMRDPPLQERTVAHYILEALKLESLEHENERTIEVLNIWKEGGGAKGLMARRYKSLEMKVGWKDDERK